MNITALVPVKTNSERLKNKNFLMFCGQPLYQVILDKLQAIKTVNKIVINTDSEIIAKECSERYSKATIIIRPQEIRGNEITMNAIIAYDLTRVSGEHFLQTHCTNPLISIKTIEHAISTYFRNLSEFDSLLSVQSIKKRAYNFNGDPINHSNSILEQTQNLPEVFIENSNLFIFSRTSFYNNSHSRVGSKPLFFPMNYIEGIDIDYPEDFILAELVYKNIELFHTSN